jgi:hypothetical protein
MDALQLSVDCGFVFTLMIIGSWLERINDKHGFFDELLTPLPLGIVGMMVLMERVWA